jgi:hypothetical protein
VRPSTSALLYAKNVVRLGAMEGKEGEKERLLSCQLKNWYNLLGRVENYV